MNNNFWNKCPRELGHFPEVTCPLGKLGAETKGTAVNACNWYVNSAEDYFCFWKWVRRRSNIIGYMEPLNQNEITNLLGYSNNKINLIIKSSIEKIEKHEEFQELKKLYLST